MYTTILRPLLIVHVTVVCICLYLSFYMVTNGFRARFPIDDKKLELKTGIMKPSKLLWGLGLAWFGFLLWLTILSDRFDMAHTVIFLGLGFFIPAGIALIIQKALPIADRRHRIIGRICLLFFTLMLATTTITYYLIYLAKY